MTGRIQLRLCALLLCAGAAGCSSSRGYGDSSYMTTQSLPAPRPAESMYREPARPYGGYGLGNGQPASKPGDYRWNGNPERVQHGAAPASAVPPAQPVVTADGRRAITVRPGDTLYSLARSHGISVVELAEYNHLSTPGIQAGQVLMLPSHAR